MNKSLTMGNNLRKEKVSRRKKIICGIIITTLIVTAVANITLFTPTLADSVDTLMKFISTWAKKIGGVVIFVGGVDFALGWKNDDPSERIRGLKTFVAGAMIVAVAVGYTSFIA